MSEKDYGIRASQMAPSQMEAVRRMEADLAALRARVRELEEAVEAARASAIREAVAALPRSPLFSGVDMVSIEGWHIHRHELLATLLPAPAPGRDTAGPGTTTSRDLVSEANVTSNASIAAGGNDEVS